MKVGNCGLAPEQRTDKPHCKALEDAHPPLHRCSMPRPRHPLHPLVEVQLPLFAVPLELVPTLPSFSCFFVCFFLTCCLFPVCCIWFSCLYSRSCLFVLSLLLLLDDTSFLLVSSFFDVSPVVPIFFSCAVDAIFVIPLFLVFCSIA